MRKPLPLVLEQFRIVTSSTASLAGEYDLLGPEAVIHKFSKNLVKTLLAGKWLRGCPSERKIGR